MKKGILVASVAITTLLLGACSTKSTSSNSSSSSTRTTVKSAKTVNTGWNRTKGEKLATYMQGLGTASSHTFTQITAGSDAEWYDLNLGEYIQKDKHVIIDGSSQAVKWLPKERSGSRKIQNVLAVYADTQNHVIYLFTKIGKTTRVLSAKNKANKGLLDVAETDNKDLEVAFAKIAAGKSVKTPVKKASTTSTSTAAKPTKKATAATGPYSDGVAQPFTFPSEYQGTWYSEDNDSESTITISGSILTVDGYTSHVFKTSPRTTEDQEIDSGDKQPSNTYKENSWLSADSLTSFNGNNGFLIEGWYPTPTANGTAYFVGTADNDSAPMLTLAHIEAGLSNTHYFRDTTTAENYKDTKFGQDDDEKQSITP